MNLSFDHGVLFPKDKNYNNLVNRLYAENQHLKAVNSKVKEIMQRMPKLTEANAELVKQNKELTNELNREKERFKEGLAEHKQKYEKILNETLEKDLAQQREKHEKNADEKFVVKQRELQRKHNKELADEKRNSAKCINALKRKERESATLLRDLENVVNCFQKRIKN